MLSNILSFLGVCLLEATAQSSVSDLQWSTTIDVAGKQRMLSQRMSKEMLMVAYGIGSKAKVQASVNEYNTALKNLMNGSSELNIVAAPSSKIKAAFDIVLEAWTPFKALLLDNLDTIGSSSETVKADLATQIGVQSVSVLVKSNTAVVDLLTFAQVSGASTATDVVNIASRQRMLIQRMAKEALLVGLGQPSVLKSTAELYRSSHDGIILGAPWAGVTTLTKVCTMSQMALVSDEWKQFKPLVDEIVGADTDEASKNLASSYATTITDKTDTFFMAMVNAVKLFINDDGSCNAVQLISEAQWGKLIANVGKQRFLGEKVAQLFMQIVLGVEPESSQVELTVQTVATQTHVRTLVEGDLATNSPTAPTQDVMNTLLNAYAAWTDLKSELDRIINTGTWDAGSVDRVARLTSEHLDVMNEATDQYVELAKQYAPGMNSKKVDIAGRQRMLFQKISFEASIINYGKNDTAYWDKLGASINLWITTHWDLLEGNAAYNISRTTNLCVVQQMQLAKTQFDLLRTAAMNVASGDRNSVNDLISINPVAFKEMNTAVGYYSTTGGNITCDPHANTDEEWENELIELGKLRYLTQHVVGEMYLDMLTTESSNSSSSSFASAILAVEDTLKSLTFGDGSRSVPAPETQSLLDSMIELRDTWPNFKANITARASGSCESSSSAMLAGVGSVLQQNMDAMADASIVKTRINTMSRQLMFASAVMKEGAGQALNVNGASERMEQAISSYEQEHSKLFSSAQEIEERTGRADLREQLSLVDTSWATMKGHTEVLASSAVSFNEELRKQEVGKLREAWQALIVAIDDAVLLYAIADPDDIPPTPPGPPWTLILYCCIGTVLSFICCLACFHAGACRKEDANAKNVKNKSSWQTSEVKEESNQKKDTHKPDTPSRLAGPDLESPSPPKITPSADAGVKSSRAMI